MAYISVNPTSYTVTDKSQNTVNINYTSDVILTDIKLSTDNGSTYKDKVSMTQTSAIFDINGMSNNNYNCKLKGYYEENDNSDTIPVTGIEVDNKVSMTQTSAIFDINGMSNNNYNCKLKGYYEENDNSDTIPVTGIEVDNWDVKLEVGQTKQLNARVIPANACKLKGYYEENDNSDTIPVTGIEVDNWDVKLEVGQTKQLNARVIPANATNQNVNWFSNNTSIATVNSTGLIKAVKAGYAKITATTEDGNIPYDVHVNVSAAQTTVTSGIKTDPASVTVVVGGTADITMLFGNDVTNKSMEYMSSNGAIATVSDLGDYKYRISGNGIGQTSIRFRTSDGKYETSCNVTVTASSSGGGGSIGGDTSTSSEYTKSCTSEYMI